MLHISHGQDPPQCFSICCGCTQTPPCWYVLGVSNQQATHAEKVMSEEHEKENALEADSKIQVLYPGRGHTQVISE